MRCPRVLRPATMPKASTARTSSPWRATNHRTGRAKRPAPFQCIVFGNLRARTDAPRSPGRTSAAERPTSWTRASRYSPFGVAVRSRASTAMPAPFAKPFAAFVGFPAASYATFTAGPVTSRTRSSWRSATASTRRARRRGVPIARTGPWPSRASARPSSARRSRSASAGAMNDAGNSSQPISRRTSRDMRRPREKRVSQFLALLQVGPGGQARHLPDAPDRRHALRDADRAPRLEQVEHVRALHDVVVARQDEPRLQQADGLAFELLEQLEEERRVRVLEV